MITTVLFDLDGVIRHFDPQHAADIEHRHGLEPGTLMSTAFRPEHVTPAITGKMSRAEWFGKVGTIIGCPAATSEWLTDIGTPDPVILAMIDDLRSQDVTIAMLTNGTTAIHDELRALDIAHHFDTVFNSAIIGIAKPDPGVYAHVCLHLSVSAGEVVFVDDSIKNVAAAADAGMSAHHFESVPGLRNYLLTFDELGLKRR